MLTDPKGTNDLSHAIIGCAIRVHTFLGPGVFEAVYRECMIHELRAAGLSFEAERTVPLVYRGTKLNARYYIDLVVEDRIAVELKAVPRSDLHIRQVLTQLRLSGLPVGLLINFDVVRLVDGIKRVINPSPAGGENAPP
jgi:GxxExxY protein